MDKNINVPRHSIDEAVVIVARQQLTDFKIHFNILLQLARQQMILRYRRTAFGYIWTLLNPLLMMAVSTVVFSSIFKMEFKSYSIFIFSGMVGFNMFSTIVTQCGQSIVNNEQLIKKIYVPKVLFPIATSVTALVDSCLMLVALFLMMVLTGSEFSIFLLALVPFYLLLYTFSLGIGLILSIATVYFRDLLHITTIVLQATLFLTPVYFTTEAVDKGTATLINLNPLSEFIRLIRAPICSLDLPSLGTISKAAIYALLSISTGLFFFRKKQHKVIFKL